MSVPPPPSTSTPEHRSGFVSLVGRPNVGKSTLLNRLLGQKIAIVSPKPQTTRNRIRGVRTLADAQIVYVDTPGLHPPRGPLGRFMAAATAEALEGVDVVVFVADAAVGRPEADQAALTALGDAGAGPPVLLALNKIDLVRERARLLPLLDGYRERYPFQELIPLSAVRGDGVERLEAAVLARLRPGPAFYPAETVTDQPETFFVAETIREKLFLATRQEVPYASAVRVEEMADRSAAGPLYIRAVVFVEQPSQKAIVIGERGARLKHIGQGARRELEAFFGVRVYLDLWVQVRPDWRRDVRALGELGYQRTS
jgi:GTP-binding protein Era